MQVEAVVETYVGAVACETTAQVVFEGFGCAPNTLQIFLLALSIVVSATVPGGVQGPEDKAKVLLGLVVELIGNCRCLASPFERSCCIYVFHRV